MSRSNEETVRRFVDEVINQGNYSVLDDIVHPNYRYHGPDQTLEGKDALQGLFTSYRSAFPDMTVEIDDLVSTEEKTVISFTLTGTHQGDLMGIPASGNPVRVKGMTLSHYSRGKIVEEWELLDQLALFQQLGINAIPEKPEIGKEEDNAMNLPANHETAIGKTLVLGGTGKSGRRIVDRLRARGIETRTGSRSANPAFDWNAPDGWSNALNGVTAVYISYAPDLAIPGATDSIRRFVDLAADKGVQKLVLLSGRGEQEAQACERIVQDSGIDWTVVRASWFMQNFSEGAFLDMVLSGAITLPAADVPEPFIDVNDIADVAVAALTEKGHAGEIYEVTGPRLLTFSDLAREISRATGREVRFMRIPQQSFAQSIEDAGMPDEIAWLLNYLFETVLDGRNSRVCDGVKRALGREPNDFANFAHRIAAEGIWDTKRRNVVAA